MLSVVVNSDDPALSDVESYLFFNLLFSAGAETTRNAIAGGLLALIENPDAYAALRADPGLLPTAVEEMVRWTSPSPSKRRTATRPATLGGHAVAPGQKVLVWEGSANRDAAVFADPDRFDVAAHTEPAPGFRTGCALLPGRQSGPARTAGDLRGGVEPVSVGRLWPSRSSGPAATGTPASGTWWWSSAP